MSKNIIDAYFEGINKKIKQNKELIIQTQKINNKCEKILSAVDDIYKLTQQYENRINNTTNNNDEHIEQKNRTK